MKSGVATFNTVDGVVRMISKNVRYGAFMWNGSTTLQVREGFCQGSDRFRRVQLASDKSL